MSDPRAPEPGDLPEPWGQPGLGEDDIGDAPDVAVHDDEAGQ